jgi:hypothetical protein
MPEFIDLRRQLQAARTDADGASEEVFTARDRLRRIDARAAAMARGFDPNNERHVGEKQRLDAERAQALRAMDAARRRLEQVRATESGAFGRFAELSDPIKAIAQFEDTYPILMLPVRLETRFKRVDSPEPGRVSTNELWVRIYPDDCSIDTFEPKLSEREADSARLYWIGIWQAGGFEDQERGAWRNLVASHGSGRAEYIVSQYVPLNLPERPVKANATDIVLTIAADAPPNPAEKASIEVFWVKMWLAGGNLADDQAAFAALAGAVGNSRAAEIAAAPPANVDAQPPAGMTRDDVAVTVSFLVLPRRDDLDVKQHSWTRAPRAALLPDRFVFIGYSGTAPPVVRVGAPVPSSLIVGPDPSAPPEEQLKHDANGDLVVPDEIKWLIDFDRAVGVGMGLRIPLDEAQARGGFDRVLVLGIRASDGHQEGANALRTLIEHHRFSRGGLEVLPQGTPTNNTDTVSTPFARGADADASFDDLKKGDLFDDSSSWLDKADGQWLAEYLGLDTAVFKRVHNSGGRDQSDARAMNTVLWPATLGYWMETMMSPVFDTRTVERTREFFTAFVSGRGGVPAIRIGRQPYGILPATAYSRASWMDRRDDILRRSLDFNFLSRLKALLRTIHADWGTMSASVSHAGKAGDPHQILLDIVGLHPGSVEYASRWAESAQQLYNQLNLSGWGWLIVAALQLNATDLLARLGYSGAPPDILSKFFYGRHDQLKGSVVDDVPLSETERVRMYTTDNRNYLKWLVDAARTSLDALYRQEGFTDNKPPVALLYLLARQSLQLGYHDISVRLHVDVGLLDQAAAARAKRDEPFIHIREQLPQSESRYQLLYKTEQAITGSPTLQIGNYIGQSLPILVPAQYMNRQLQALELLTEASTARLERAFAEHIDCCTYRFDAWLLGLVHAQLALMRDIREGERHEPRQGIHLGAYAWLEDVRPENKVLTPVVLEDPELVKDFQRGGDPPLLRDSANQGYIHAPSLNQAVAAAVLRNGYMSNASPANRQTMAVNLTSERVRTAMSLLEGIRGGQSLAALLGYQFERGLHDRHSVAEVDEFIFDLRGEFPLASNRMASTKAPEGTPIEAIEARNVIDGLALVNHIKASGNRVYPFGRAALPPASDAQRDAITAEADRLVEAHDAVADVALAEGVYQAVLGNYDRVASTYDAYSKGDFPPEPQVVRTPSSGIGLTHRVALHLESGLAPTASPLGAGVPMTPRAHVEPAINRWLFDTLPPLQDIGCIVSFRDAATNAIVERQVTLLDLAVQPADLIRLVRDDNRQEMSELDDRIVRRVVVTHGPRPDTQMEVRYMETDTARLSVFEVMPLVRHLRRLVESSRPLRSSDITLTKEATGGQDAVATVDRQRIAGARATLQTLRTDLQNFVDGIAADPATRIAEADAYVTAVASLLPRAASFGIPQTGWGFAFDFKRRFFGSVLAKAAGLVERWNTRLLRFAEILGAYNPAADELDKIVLLQQAALQITVLPLPAAPNADAIKVLLETTFRNAFVAKQAEFAGLQDTHRTSVALLLQDAQALLPIVQFDVTPLSFDEDAAMAVAFADDVASVVRVVLSEIDRRLAASQTLLDEHDAASQPAARVEALDAAAKALLGEEAFVVPEFTLSAAQGDEVANAVAASNAGTLFQHLTSAPEPDEFPVDTWMYGVARVREKVRSFEQVVMLSEAFEIAAPALTPIQLPFIADDGWLALEIAPQATLETERLLYTACFAAPFHKTEDQCGLLIDEWSEVIPSVEVETGLSFHYDRPNCEASQVMLLVTPTDARGSWQWDDLVDALRETLDLAKRRGVEPVHVDGSAYARFLPATVSAVTRHQITISTLLTANNNLAIAGDDQ